MNVFRTEQIALETLQFLSFSKISMFACNFTGYHVCHMTLFKKTVKQKSYEKASLSVKEQYTTFSFERTQLSMKVD